MRSMAGGYQIKSGPDDFDQAMRQEEAFWRKVERVGECWVWKGTRLIKGGKVHLQFSTTLSSLSPKRLCWRYIMGEDPPADRILRNACGNRFCVRPDHQKITKEDAHD